jgi:hypothetical protein
VPPAGPAAARDLTWVKHPLRHAPILKTMNKFLNRALLALALVLPLAVHATGAIGPVALRTRHTTLAPQLANNAFGGPLVLQSEEVARRIDGDVYAVVDHPFTAVSAALSDPAQWCDILILHLNTKFCRKGEDKGAVRVEVRVGKKQPQAVDAASLLAFTWRAPTVRPDYVAVQMDAADGPYDTRDYRLMAEAVPLEGNRTFLHMGYALSYGGASDFAMHLYLGTIGRDKVGFTRASAPRATDEGYVGGMRGVVERNTMRYYLAIDSYLDSLAAPSEQRLEKRLQAWFDATEKYPRQLREVERDAYLKMKRAEVQRQSVAR